LSWAKKFKKIVGPGNPYVTMAKILVSRDVLIDFPAGPTEIVILADEIANPKFIAYDLISQAEHGSDSIVVLVTTSEKLAKSVMHEIKRVLSSVPRSEIVSKAISDNGFVILCETMDEAINFVNFFAPEHLEIILEEKESVAERINSAGLVLLGDYSPVALSDYCIGVSHVLPTNGFARIYSGLSVLDFVKTMCVIECNIETLETYRNTIKVLAYGEGLPNHSSALEVRLK